MPDPVARSDLVQDSDFELFKYEENLFLIDKEQKSLCVVDFQRVENTLKKDSDIHRFSTERFNEFGSNTPTMKEIRIRKQIRIRIPAIY